MYGWIFEPKPGKTLSLRIVGERKSDRRRPVSRDNYLRFGGHSGWVMLGEIAVVLQTLTMVFSVLPQFTLDLLGKPVILGVEPFHYAVEAFGQLFAIAL